MSESETRESERERAREREREETEGENERGTCCAWWHVLEQDQIVEVPVQKQVQIPMVQTVQRHKGHSKKSLRNLDTGPSLSDARLRLAT